MKQSARYFIHGHNTCNVERYHRERLKLTPKLFEFWKTWAPRCALNQLFHNYGFAETHRLVLAKIDELPTWSLDIVPGNQYMAAMDRERAYHSARKSDPTYNRREDQLAREFGKRRAAHDRTSSCRGHDYQHTPPLYAEEEYGEELRPQRKPRRSKEQIERENAEEEAEKQRLKALFNGGDTTFTTLGVIDVNLKPKGTKKGKKGKKGEEEEDEREKEEKVTRAAGKENLDHPPPPALRRKRRRGEQPTVASMEVETLQQRADVSGDDRRSTMTSAGAGSSPLSQATVARAIVFR